MPFSAETKRLSLLRADLIFKCSKNNHMVGLKFLNCFKECDSLMWGQFLTIILNFESARILLVSAKNHFFSRNLFNIVDQHNHFL